MEEVSRDGGGCMIVIKQRLREVGVVQIVSIYFSILFPCVGVNSVYMCVYISMCVYICRDNKCV